MNDTYTAAMGYLGKSSGILSKDKCHRTFPNLVLKGKLREEVRFVCAWETGGEKLSSDRTGTINKTVASVLVEKYPHETFPHVLLRGPSQDFTYNIIL